jgi:hypothetical protein
MGLTIDAATLLWPSADFQTLFVGNIARLGNNRLLGMLCKDWILHGPSSFHLLGSFFTCGFADNRFSNIPDQKNESPTYLKV